MNLTKLNIDIRPRSNWEAIDLGTLLARQHYGLLIQCGILTMLPVAMACFVSLFYLPSWVGLLIFWWLKPFYERAMLYTLSQAIFTHPPTLKAVVRQLPSLLKKQWLAWLTVYRLSPSRSFNQNVSILENLRGNAYSKRLSDLHYANGTAKGGGWLTVIGIHIEGISHTALLTIIAFLFYLDNSTQSWWDFSRTVDEGALLSIISMILAYLIVLLIAPFYVASGFTLYLNRRIQLEGWDIEQQFRNLVNRSENKA